jgi:hypothetical protein
LLLASFASAAILGGSAIAQAVDPTIAQIPSDQITLFSGSSFNGASLVVTGPRTNLNIPYRIRSVMIRQGRPWEICSRTQYRNCQTYNAPIRNVSITVGSARPVRPAIQPPIQPPIVGGGRSLRGMASEYFPAPLNPQGARVELQNATGNAAAERADRFCKRIGWNGSAYERLQTVSGRVYLADVLCVQSGF